MKNNYKVLLEKLFGKPYNELLVEMYVEKGMSIREIAKELGLSIGTVHNTIKELGLVKKLKWD